MKMPPLLTYTVLRLLAFLVPFGLLMLFPVFRGDLLWLAAIFATLIGLSLSIIFLRQPLSEASSAIARRRDARGPRTNTDEDIEDDVIDHPTTETTDSESVANAKVPDSED